MLEALVRAEDQVCRLGGDEFTVLLPDTRHDQGQCVLARIRTGARLLSSVGLGSRPLALGLASWRFGDGQMTLVSRADEQMYADKRSAELTDGASINAAWPSLSSILQNVKDWKEQPSETWSPRYAS